jgi:hypothetical protein
MRIPKKRCAHCHKWFPPDPRTAASQKFCSRPECREQSRLQSHRRWWRDNGADTDAARRPKLRAWAKAAGYWRQYRAGHPDYVRRENERRCRTHRRTFRAAKQDMRRQISVGKLRDIRALAPATAAKQDMIHRQTLEVVDYLLWKEGAAKQDITDLQPVSG